MSVLFHERSHVTIGEVCRYVIRYNRAKSLEPASNPPSSFSVRVRNLASHIYRAAYLNGPWTICVSSWPLSFDPFAIDRGRGEVVEYEATLKTASSFWSTLRAGVNTEVEHCWIIEVSSQVLFSKIKVPFSVTLGISREDVNAHHASSSIPVCTS
jgi:hypothetical protein